MAADMKDMLTAGKIAETLGVPGAKVKKAINELKIKPDAKKGPCAYYAKGAVAKIQAHLK